jgi:hypothetical protein
MRFFILILIILALLFTLDASRAQLPNTDSLLLVPNSPPSSGSGPFTITANSTATSGCSANTVLYSDGSLVQCSATLPSGLTIPGYLTSLVTGTTAITGGATTQVLFNNGGVLGSDAGLTKVSGATGQVTFGGPISGPAGSATATTYNFGTAGTGIFGSSTTVQFSVGGSLSAYFGTGLVIVGSGTSLNIEFGNGVNTYLGSSGAGVITSSTNNSHNGLGTFTAASFAPGIIYSAAGTAVPACGAGTNGWTVVASDITTATYRTAYVSGGSNTGRLFCLSGTGWLSD